jgi:hypothetical protein
MHVHPRTGSGVGVRSAKRLARLEAEKKRDGKLFVPLPFAVIRSESYANLSAHAVKLLNDMLAAYNLRNNGDLSVAWKVMSKRGWRSKQTLYKALRELLDKEFVIQTRAGGLHQCSLYAVTFFAIDPCEGKLDVKPTSTALGLWRKDEPVPVVKPTKNNSSSTSIVPITRPNGARIVPAKPPWEA